MKSPSLARLSGLATALGGLLFAGFGLIHYVYTHGSTGVDRNGTLFGLGGTDYCRMQVAWPALLAVGLIGLRSTYLRRADRLVRVGSTISLGALALQLLSVVLECWITNPDVPADFESVPHLLGFYLGVYSQLVLAVGIVALGIGVMCARALPRWQALPLVIGLLVMPTLVFPALGLSTGGPTWDLIYAASSLPLGLCWVLLGSLLWTESSPRTAWLADCHNAAPSRN